MVKKSFFLPHVDVGLSWLVLAGFWGTPSIMHYLISFHCRLQSNRWICSSSPKKNWLLMRSLWWGKTKTPTLSTTWTGMSEFEGLTKGHWKTLPCQCLKGSWLSLMQVQNNLALLSVWECGWPGSLPPEWEETGVWINVNGMSRLSSEMLATEVLSWLHSSSLLCQIWHNKLPANFPPVTKGRNWNSLQSIIFICFPLLFHWAMLVFCCQKSRLLPGPDVVLSLWLSTEVFAQ